MGTVVKRVLPSGLIRWRAAYTDAGGVRRKRQFARKADAEAWLVEVQHSLARGTHVPDSVSPTVREAAALWLKRSQEKGLEKTSIDQYDGHVRLHIIPLIGNRKLSEITVPAVHAFADELLASGRSHALVAKIITSLGGIYREARRRGLAAVDPTAGINLNLRDRDDPRPDIPSKAELQAIIANATGRWRPLILTAVFAGLRASELRGLRWQDIDFDKKTINVNQRANASNKLGRLKSRAAYRSIPMPPILVNALREWKLLCPKGDLGLTFPNGLGKIEGHSAVLRRGLYPILWAAGINADYGMHSLRHACASLWIEEGMNPKKVQTLMGHSSIAITFNVYGHLFSDADADQRAAANVQARLLGS